MSEHGKSSSSLITMINTSCYYMNEQGIEVLELSDSIF